MSVSGSADVPAVVAADVAAFLELAAAVFAMLVRAVVAEVRAGRVVVLRHHQCSPSRMSALGTAELCPDVGGYYILRLYLY